MIWNKAHNTSDEELAKLDHPYTLPRAKMKPEMRAAQFSPFDALSGYGEIISDASDDWNKNYEKENGYTLGPEDHIC